MPVAEMMGEVAGLADPEFIALVGDTHHFQGVRSVQDPLWLTNFEWIYTHPGLMIAWHPVLGNHEYEGSTQAVLDYAKWKVVLGHHPVFAGTTKDEIERTDLQEQLARGDGKTVK